MSRKKQAPGPDLFSTATVPISARNGSVAVVCGEVSGIPDSLAKAVASLRDVERRCEAARAVAGILDERQGIELGIYAIHVRKIMSELEKMQRETHEMHMAGIGLPKVEPEMDLL